MTHLSRSHFQSADDAAIAALTVANPRSIARNLEYSGLILRDAAGRYTYTLPSVGTVAHASLSHIVVPRGYDEVGHYHAHGDYSGATQEQTGYIRLSPEVGRRFDGASLRYSEDDIREARRRAVGRRGYRSYLGRPDGTFLFLDVDTMQVGLLPRRPPRLAPRRVAVH